LRRLRCLCLRCSKVWFGGFGGLAVLWFGQVADVGGVLMRGGRVMWVMWVM
jgi:hypothetical protein